MRAMQCTQFCAKSAKNDLKSTDFLKRNFYFETEGVGNNESGHFTVLQNMVLRGGLHYGP